ncbi:CRISPR-associated endonuclease Cas3'' [Xinfangfangia sp. LG-4]|uniref:CRISPR-associated endonuclease Cas3 n=2 Tax=Ruixingdingia sedimenti TaxID=3073604 RepID=A0ABU1FA21_9RHOB|nr:CRISPR-associated endonuclease Cas3'' [Xinfangfangia sp. LG-4]MDR5653468.1 CRISPR-associated endonuclease Cas3'' [Xinfangfangia sp. LG-4]
MLDVAAVAERLLRTNPLPDGWKAAFVLLIALHDLGKIGAGFRAMIRAGMPQAARHWELTEAWLLGDDRLSGRLQADPWAMRALIPATAGHHGRTSKQEERFFPRLRAGAGVEAADIPGRFRAGGPLARCIAGGADYGGGLDRLECRPVSGKIAGPVPR